MRRTRDHVLDVAGTDALLRAVISLCLGQFRRHEAAYLAAPGPETLHQARVSLRWLRSALALFRPLTGPPPELADGLRRLGGALGEARDLDVLLAGLPPGKRHDRLAAAQHEAAATAIALLRAAPTRAMLLALADWIMLHPPLPNDDARAFAARQLDRCRRKVKQAGRALLRGGDADRHRLRRRVKRLHHASALLGSLFPGRKRQAQFRAALIPLQDVLGTMNDLVVGQALLARIDGHTAAAAARTQHEGMPALVTQAAQLLDDLLAAPRFWR